MAFVPSCRFDLFISYATENNSEGWVEQFQGALGTELSALIGRKFAAKESIYFDKRELEVGQSFPAELAAAARESAMLLPILSPSYLTSSWCYRERTDFFSQRPNGAAPESCLAPIQVRPIDDQGLDALYRNAQRFLFLSADGQTPLAPGSPEWKAQIYKLAGQLKSALERLRQSCKPIFVGEAPDGERPQKLRDWCCKELERRHFRAVPESLLVFQDENGVVANLKDAGLSVHFVGGADEAALNAIETSAQVCAGPTILYQAFGETLTNDEQFWLQEFEQQLPVASGRYQKLQGKNDQELLALIDEQIASHARPVTNQAQVQLALVCEEPDLNGAREIKDQILARCKIEVGLPDFLAGRMTAMERLRKWRDYLTHSQRLLFYYGVAARDHLEPICLKAEQVNSPAARNWFVAPPDLEAKRHEHPDALWNIDQVISLIQPGQSA
jgi:hypothetical protein